MINNSFIHTDLSFGSKKTFKREFDRCAYSGEKFEQHDTATIEHIIPAINGGEDEFSNYLVVKRSWNMDRSDTPLDEYIKENPIVKENIIAAVNSKNGRVLEGINWSEEVKKTLLKAIGYDIFKN
jgi:5-methylcytosine-specific restriction endonuclease McrA